jgi:hypothetical protein
MNLKSFSQTSGKDTSVTCLPNSTLRLAAQKIRVGELDHQKVGLQQQKIDTMLLIQNGLALRIIQKDSALATYEKLEANYKAETANLTRQRDEERKISDDLLKKLKGQKRKTIFVGITGALAVGATIFLHHK